jgi:hypothetical protein
LQLALLSVFLCYLLKCLIFETIFENKQLVNLCWKMKCAQTHGNSTQAQNMKTCNSHLFSVFFVFVFSNVSVLSPRFVQCSTFSFALEIEICLTRRKIQYNCKSVKWWFFSFKNLFFLITGFVNKVGRHSIEMPNME